MKNLIALSGITLLASARSAWASTVSSGSTYAMNPTAIVIFFVFVCVTLGITKWAAKRTRTASDFFSAGGGITGIQNGLAVAGDYMSASTLLGIVSLVFARGYDGLLYCVGFFIGWPVMLLLMAERVRNLGRFTIVDIVASRFDLTGVRLVAALSSLVVVFLYLIIQMVGAGELVQLMFGIQYNYAVICVGVLMIIYVSLGGMIATTWVQIIKAVLIMFGATLLLILSLAHFDFNFEALAAKAVSVHSKGIAIMGPGAMFAEPISALSLSLATVFGLCGMPHILMRFFTVRNARDARTSVLVATSCVGYMYLAMFVIGLASVVLVGTNPSFFEGGVVGGRLLGGGNMVALHLASATGGNVFLGFLAAVTFATILAVVSGLALAGASSISHDIYANVIRRGEPTRDQFEVRLTRWATIAIGVVAVGLGILFRGQSVAFLLSLAFNVAASANFPLLSMTMYWRGTTGRGAMWGSLAGLVSSVCMLILSPSVWKMVLGHAHGIFPYDNPALFSMPLAFAAIYVVSKLDRSAAAQRTRGEFDAQFVRAQTGLGTSSGTALN
ncbi:cation/acetate symporter ActP [Caballeronia sp. 15711]|uniref:cation/acetate symporter ActP n=1 Tax=Caballeronia sp. 15711 TaxID=3391029 RepID=UPI0039E3A84A